MAGARPAGPDPKNLSLRGPVSPLVDWRAAGSSAPAQGGADAPRRRLENTLRKGMGSMNKVILIGRLGKDPEDRVTSNGKSVANLSLATNQFRAGNGVTEKFTEWHRIVAFGKTADQCKQYLRKGRLICVEGSLRTRSWEKPPGERHYTTEVVAARVDFLDSQGGSPPPETPGAEAGDGLDDGL